jgi:hypothetical protein
MERNNQPQGVRVGSQRRTGRERKAADRRLSCIAPGSKSSGNFLSGLADRLG